MSFFPGIVLWKAFLESGDDYKIKTARHQISAVCGNLLQEKSIQSMTKYLLSEMKILSELEDFRKDLHLKHLIYFVDILFDFCAAKITKASEEGDTDSDTDN